MIKVSVFRWVPEGAQGFVRDLRVRWALEEAGLAYEEMLIGGDDQASAAYRRLQPFGQVPAYVDGELEMFESGAIVQHIAESCEALMPLETKARARTKTWMFAALNSVEPFVANLVQLEYDAKSDPSANARRPDVEKRLSARLTALEAALGDKAYLEERFTAADILMSTVLRELCETKALAELPKLTAYLERCTSRGGFRKALSDQMAVFAKNAPR